MYMYSFYHRLSADPLNTVTQFTIPNLLSACHSQYSLFITTSGLFMHMCYFSFYGMVQSDISVYKPHLLEM